MYDLSDGLEYVDSLLYYIHAYRKGNSFDDFTLAQILTLEDINQSVYYILAIISDDEEQFFEIITLVFFVYHSINMDT